MKRSNIKTILLTLLFSMVDINASAHDIALANDDGKTIYYVWKNDKTELAVSFKGKEYDSYIEYSGRVNVPETVTYNGVTYPVTSVESYAFFHCDELTAVSLPKSVTSIGRFAFDPVVF